jgi:hypothetical protein
MAAKFGPDQVVLPAHSSDPAGTRPAGEIYFNTSQGVFKYHDGSTGWKKVSAELAVLTSVSGDFYVGTASTITLAGSGFLSNTLVVNFVLGGTTSNVNVTASSNTSATVAVPSAIYNAASDGSSVDISVTNVDGSSSGAVSKTYSVPPFTATISPAISGITNWDFSGASVATASGASATNSNTEYTLTNTSGLTRTFYFKVWGAQGGNGGSGGSAQGGITLAHGASVKFMAASQGNDYAGGGAAAVYNSSNADDPYLVGGGGGGRGTNVAGGHGGGTTGGTGANWHPTEALGGGGGTQSSGGAGGYGSRGSGYSGTFRHGGDGARDGAASDSNPGRGWGNGGYGVFRNGDGWQGGGGGGYYGGGGGGAYQNGAGGGGGSGFVKSGVVSGSTTGNANNGAGQVSVKGVAW